jgi:hypothetical protein
MKNISIHNALGKKNDVISADGCSERTQKENVDKLLRLRSRGIGKRPIILNE